MKKVARLVIVVAFVTGLMVAPSAHASRFGPSGFPVYPSYPYNDRAGSGGPAQFVQDQSDPHKWVWTVDPKVYGATGTVTFYNYSNAIQHTGFMVGPGGAGVNDWQICNDPLEPCPTDGSPAFKFSRPSFTQDVDSVEADFLTPDPPSDLSTDWDPSVYHPDGLGPPSPFASLPNANMDGSANLYKFGFSITPGTQFMNMQVDRSGNYYVARRDMQWNWIDKFTYKNGSNAVDTIDTQFNIQPYPISDAYGWCGAVPPEDPNSLTAMAGQITKDIAFDVYAFDGEPGLGAPPMTTEVVPSFQMRSYGIYVVDVTMLSTGTRQQFTGISKGVHIRPAVVTIGNQTFAAGSRVQLGDPDFQHWFNRVSPFAAGVVPIGAWVINPGTQYMQVVPVGTPGAVWHQNKFAGAAFIVRGDMERRVNYINAGSAWSADQVTTSDFNEVYKDLIDAGTINPKTGDPWKRADWTDWAENNPTQILPDAY